MPIMYSCGQNCRFGAISKYEGDESDMGELSWPWSLLTNVGD